PADLLEGFPGAAVSGGRAGVSRWVLSAVGLVADAGGDRVCHRCDPGSLPESIKSHEGKKMTTTPTVKRCVLAYSGGLDTSIIVPWLRNNYQCEVICFCANLGQGEDMTGIEEKALASGASKC